jgi:PAS domain S-box-containing protein
MSTSVLARRPRSSTPVNYGIAVLSAAVAIAAAVAFDRSLGTGPSVSLFLCTIMFVAWATGTGPALLTAALTILAFNWFLLQQAHSFSLEVGELARVVFFTVAALFVVLLSAAYHRAADSLRQARDEQAGMVLELRRLNESLVAENAERQNVETELRRSEAHLAATQHELQQTIDTIPGIVTCYGPDGERDFVNKPWRDYAGLTLSDIQGEGWRRIIHPDDAEESLRKWRISLATGEPFDFEHRLRRADGEWRWHMIRRVALRGTNGEILRWYGIGFDIEEQKRAEAALRESEARVVEAQRELQATIDTIPVMVASYSREGIRDFMNKTGLDYIGHTLEELMSDRWPNLIAHPDEFDSVETKWRASLAKGEPFQAELRIRRADGQFRRHLSRRVPLRDDKGNILKWYAAALDIEDQKKAEDALRRSEADLAEARRELQLTIDTIPALASRYRADGTTDFVNQIWRSYTGLPQESWAGRGSAVVHPDDRQRIEQAWATHLAAAEPFDVEQRMRRADGEYRWYFVRRVPLRDDGGNVIAWYGAGYDIEDRKRAELALRTREAELAEAQRELQLTLDRIPILAWQTRSDGYAEYLNKRWLDYTGLSIEQALGWDWQIVVHPDDLPGLLVVWRRMLASGKAEEVEARMRRFDGEYRWFLFRPSPLRDEAGNVVRWYGTNTDIEDRKQAESALQRSEAYLAEAQKLTLTGSFGWKTLTGETYWSEEFYKIMGFERRIKPSLDIVMQRTHPDDRPFVQNQLDRAIHGEKNFDYEHRLLMPDGQTKHLHVRAQLVRDASGANEMIGAMADVTQAKKAQEALQAAQAELAHASRVAVLGEISASIAHEVNQPLAAIVANGEACLRFLAREEPDLNDVRGAVEWIVKDGNRAGDVIQRVRTLTKKTEGHRAKLDVNDAVDDVLVLLQRELLAHRISVQRDLAAGLPSVVADRVQLQQVIINLTMNAIEAMQAVAGRARRLTIRSYQDDSGQVIVAVEDSGAGFTAESQDRLFHAFFSTKPGGLGMGLSICRSIIEAHGGRLSASANTGRGATFQFALPLAEDAA